MKLVGEWDGVNIKYKFIKYKIRFNKLKRLYKYSSIYIKCFLK